MRPAEVGTAFERSCVGNPDSPEFKAVSPGPDMDTDENNMVEVQMNDSAVLGKASNVRLMNQIRKFHHLQQSSSNYC